ncbi:1585_t:CDS:10, partial [Funneliformis caledonium]
YLTKVTEHQLCLMSYEDLESFDWNLYNTDVDSDDDKGFHEFEVSKSQEVQDDFKIYPGFKVKLSDKIKSEIQNTQEDGVPLHPIGNNLLIKETIRPQNDDRKTMDMNSLEILVTHGLQMEDELITFRNEIQAAKFQYEEKKKHEIDTIKKDCDIISNLAWKKLSDRYGLLDRKFSEIPSRENIIDISDKDLVRIHSKYPDKVGQIDEAIKINSNNWNKLKCRYILTSTIIFDILENNEDSARHFKDILFIDFVHELINSEILTKKKYMTKNLKDKNFVQDLISSKNMLNIKSIKDLMNLKNISDEIFILDLVNSSYLGEDKKELISIFFEEYRKVKDIFSNEIKEILQKDSLIQKLSHHLKEEFEQEKRNIESREFHRLCNEIEEKYQNNGIDNTYLFKHEFEIIKPKQLQITIYETSLEQSDILHLHNEEFYIPNPIFLPYNNYCIDVTFQIDSSIYDFRKIVQFDNRKFLLVLYNKKIQKIEMLFNTAQQLANNFKYTIKSFKTLHIDENVFIAINELKNLIAIYDTKKVLHLFFIKDTEELCFVEKGGWTPFIKEKLEYNNYNSVTGIKDDNEIRHVADDMENINNTVNANKIKEIWRTYVYFCTNFDGSVNKIVDLPPTLQSLEFLQFTHINKLQTHLMSIDLQTECFNSSIERMQKQSIGRVRLIDSIIEEKNTCFKEFLKIAGNFKTISEFDNWMDFRIEPKSKLNEVLDLKNNDNIEEYDEKFKEYLSEIFKVLKSFTKKPSTVLKKFSTSVITFKELDIKNGKFQKYLSKYKLED